MRARSLALTALLATFSIMTPSATEAAEHRVGARSAALVLSPLRTARTVGTLERGAVVEVIDESDEWVRVRTDAGDVGWVERDAFRGALQREVPERDVRLEAGATLRARADARAAVVTRTRPGRYAVVLDTRPGWLLVREPGGSSGWVREDMVESELMPPALRGVESDLDELALEGDLVAHAVTGASTLVRSEAALDAAVVSWVATLDDVVVIDRDGPWTEVRLADDRTGWIRSSLVDSDRLSRAEAERWAAGIDSDAVNGPERLQRANVETVERYEDGSVDFAGPGALTVLQGDGEVVARGGSSRDAAPLPGRSMNDGERRSLSARRDRDAALQRAGRTAAREAGHSEAGSRDARAEQDAPTERLRAVADAVVRSRPAADSLVVARLDAGEGALVLDRWPGGWARVETASGQRGWARDAFDNEDESVDGQVFRARRASALEEPLAALRIGESADLRDAPDGTVVATIDAGQEIRIVEDRGEWIHVETNTQEGWISESYVNGLFALEELGAFAMEGSSMAISSPTLLRREPSALSSPFARLPAGTDLLVLDEDSGWMKVRTADDLRGWVRAGRGELPELDRAGAERLRVVAEDAPLLRSPTMAAPTVGGITTDERVERIDDFGDWVKVRTARGLGWVPAAILEELD